MEFIATFGQKYATEPHPKVDYAHPRGYLLIIASSMSAARDAAFKELGPYFSMVYENTPDNRRYFPAGALHTITVQS